MERLVNPHIRFFVRYTLGPDIVTPLPGGNLIRGKPGKAGYFFNGIPENLQVFCDFQASFLYTFFSPTGFSAELSALDNSTVMIRLRPPQGRAALGVVVLKAVEKRSVRKEPPLRQNRDPVRNCSDIT
jgi:hypothetical protein